MLPVETLIESIYETVAAPQLWSRLIDDTAAKSGGMGGSLFVVSERGTDWVATPSTLEFMQDYDAGRWAEHNPRVERLFAKGHRGFISDLDLFTADEISRTPIYRDFLHPRGIGWVTGTFAPLPTGGKLVLSIDRKLAQGPASREELDVFDRLHPHILRAAWVGAMMGAEASTSATRVLDAMGIAAAILDRKARVRNANAAFEALAPALLIRPNGALAARDAKANDALSNALHAAMARLPAGSSFPVRPQDATPLLIHVLPVAGQAHDLFSGGRAIIVATSAEPQASADAGLLAALFDLTPAESRVAAALAMGADTQEVARRQGTSIETVRTHIKRLLVKTGNSRQTDLVRQLASLSVRTPTHKK